MLHQQQLPPPRAVPEEGCQGGGGEDDDEAGAVGGMHAQLLEVIQENGRQCEMVRYQAHQDRVASEGSSFGADLVLREEDGFELWLGSLDDALSLEALSSRRIDALLNCATEECERECAVFRRAGRGRRRCHARGPSAMAADSAAGGGAGAGAGDASSGLATLDRDQVRAMASFDAEWYSGLLEYDVAYSGIDAVDEFGYAMDDHYAEVVAFLGKCRAERRKVLVHCIMGINRSSAAVVAFLCCDMGLSLSDAIALTSEHRGYILSNGSFLEQLIRRFGSGTSGLGAEQERVREDPAAAAPGASGGGNADGLLEPPTSSSAVACT